MRSLLVLLALAMSVTAQQRRVAADGSEAFGRFIVRDGVCSELAGGAPERALADIERVVIGEWSTAGDGGPIVTLVNGDRLTLDALELADDKLRGEHALLGEVVLASRLVHSIELALPHEDQPAAPIAPSLILSRGESLPVACTAIDYADVVAHHELLGSLTWRRGRVRHVVLHPRQDAPPSGLTVVVLTTSGDRLRGRLLLLDEAAVRLEVSFAQEPLWLPVDELSEWWVLGGAVRHAAARPLPDAALRQAAPFTATRTLARNTDFAGAPLRLGARSVSSGFAVSPSTSFVLDVQPGEQWFRCRVGLGPGQPHDIVARFRILAAGSNTTLFDSGDVSLADAPLSTGNITVHDLEQLVLQLEVDPVHAFALGVWADPVFSRSSP